MPDEHDNPDEFDDAEVSPEDFQAAEIAADDLVQQLQAELDEAVEARKRALADFKNYQRRAAENEQRAASMATAGFLKALMPALDHFDLALEQNPEQMTVENLLEAVKIVRDEFRRALASQNIERIEPKVGDAFDPHRHQAVKREQVPGAAPNTVHMIFQVGYSMGDMVLRPATVVVAAGPE